MIAWCLRLVSHLESGQIFCGIAVPLIFAMKVVRPVRYMRRILIGSFWSVRYPPCVDI